MRHHETKKLYYDQFMYKLVVVNPVAFIFRNHRLDYVRQVIDSLQRQQDAGDDDLVVSHGIRIFNISRDSFHELKRFYNFFNNTKQEYKIRVERTYMTVYSNDLPFLLKLKTLSDNPKELWQPKKGLEDLYESNTIVVNSKPEFEFKVTPPARRKLDPSFANWIIANPDKAKATKDVLKRIERGSPMDGHYFYVRDEKILHLINFMIDQIGRVDKLVYVDDQDK